jgi:Ca-activated chloride channel family protein
MFKDVSFAYPWVLYFLIIVPLMVVWYWFKGKQKQPSITYSSLSIFKSIAFSWRERLRHIPIILRALAVALLIVALARPQNFSSGENIYTEGIDIAMVLDISGSMLAEDLKPNRIDRDSFTQCPLTIDYSVLLNLLSQVKSGMIEDGTAIGNAIANGVNRLKDSKSKSKIIILLTDGVNNSGEVDPVFAAQIARTYGIRIYTIGVGTKGEAPYPVQTPFGTRYQMIPVEIDEAVLKQISEITGGEYFRATDNKTLKAIYDKIDKLEKSKVEITSYRNAKELFYPWLGAGLFLLVLEVGLSKSIFRRLP